MRRGKSSIPGRFWFAAFLILFFSLTAVAQQAKTVVLELDHTSICGANLDPLRQALTDVGLTPDFGGPHGNGVTHMAAVGFEDGTYLELIAPVKPGVTTGSEWSKFMGEDAVTCAWAVGTNVLLQEVDRLKKAGIAVTEPTRGSRKRPDGMSVEWMRDDVGSGTPGSVLPFLIEDQTPRAWRVQTSASAQGAPVSGVENVVIGVSNLDSAIALFRKAYGWSEPITESQKDWGKMAYFPGEPVILVAPNGGWVSDHVAKFGESPVAILLAARDFPAAVKKYKLSGSKTWFGQKVAWFDAGKLKGVRLGVIGSDPR
ncbi:MAG: VOC family protein [Terriglobales bacterium]|jgi:predicted enzyme related to lactoylglutathione lyase